MEILDILIPSSVTVVGFLVTIFVTCRTIRKSAQEKVTQQQRALYSKCFVKIERIIADNMLIFDEKYLTALEKYKGHMEIAASNAVLQEFRKYLAFAEGKCTLFRDFCRENDPEKCMLNYEYRLEEDGTEAEICHISSDDLELFEQKSADFKKRNCPSEKEIQENVYALLNKMRQDLNNDKYVWRAAQQTDCTLLKASAKRGRRTACRI